MKHMSIASKQYVATVGDIEKLAAIILDSRQTAENGRGTYLRALVATTRAELGLEPRLRTGGLQTVDEARAAEQLAAFEKVHQQFLAAVTKVADNSLPTPTQQELNRRTNFARTSASTLRAWLTAKFDIAQLAALRVSKHGLREQLPKSRSKQAPMSAKRAIAAIETRGQALLDMAEKALKAEDSEAAAPAIRDVAIALMKAVVMKHKALTMAKTRAEAVNDQLPIETARGIIIPLLLSAARTGSAAHH